ncbi:MAG: 2,3-diaminopropionate biosynthesis protein SbnA [Planctomyces sp.]|nr:2,3-diaminopropionate biosynthesis protein SbnA [Planctomyces sp.]
MLDQTVPSSFEFNGDVADSSHHLTYSAPASPCLPAEQDTAIDGVLNAVGKTPLVKLSRILSDRVRLYAKLECFNPGGSAKDRPAKRMIEEALRSGEINQNTTIIESSSGNMGVALAQVCGYYGLSFICVVDSRAQSHNVQIMRALGAHIICVNNPADGDFLGQRLERVRALTRAIPDSWWPNQYENLANPQAHQEGTIPEIIDELGEAPDYLFVATSSTGTARGCQQYLRKQNLHTQVVAVDAVGSVLFGGHQGDRNIPGLGAGQIPPLAEGQKFDRVERVTDIDCVVGCRRMARREAMLVGGSAGGVMETIHAMESELQGKTVVAILHDSGTRYLDTIFSDHWVEQRLGCDLDDLEKRVGKRRQANKRRRIYATGFPNRKVKTRIVHQNHNLSPEEPIKVIS